MAKRVSYLVEVAGLMLDEQGGTWIQAMPVGTYDHPVYGDLVFTPDRLQSFAASVNNRILHKDPDIDYEHKMGPQGGIAAGWVQQAQVRDNGLWLYVTWTPQAQQKLRDKEYRYFSPEFIDEWTDPKMNITYKDVILGGGLTNRPFLKDLVPINLSEMMVGDTMTFPQGGTGGSPPPTDAENWTQVARQLGLSGQVTSGDILARVAQLADPTRQQPQPQQVVPQQPVPPALQVPQNITLSVPATVPAQVPAPQFQQPPVQPAPQQQYVQPVQPQFVQPTAPAPQQQQQQQQVTPPSVVDLPSPIQLTDELKGDPIALHDLVMKQNERIQLLGAATKLADAQAKVTMLSDPSKKIVLSPAVRELAIDLLVKAPVQLAETVEKLLEAVAGGKATVVLGELGRSGAHSGSTVKQFSDAIAKVQADSGGKIGYADAMDQVSRDNPGLANAYREATMSGEGDGQ